MGHFFRSGAIAVCACAVAAASGAAPAAADDWLPHPAGATWQYLWADTTYNPAGTTENVVVQQQQGTSFTLAWADPQDKPPAAGATSLNCAGGPDVGIVTFRDAGTGLLNDNWNSCPPPIGEPVLCATELGCANSLSSAFYNVIWGARAPVLSEPLLHGTTWSSTGGAANDVSSSSRYLGLQQIKVPAFPAGVLAAVVRSNIVQAGALGDPYGSGVRTTWWVYGVGPVRVVFQHDGGSYAPTTNVTLMKTNLQPKAARPDEDYFPLTIGLKNNYRFTDTRFLRQPEVEQISVAAAVNRSARFVVKSISGPMRVAGQYGLTLRTDGLSSLYGSAQAATTLKMPKIGRGIHFLTPFDILTYGYNPVLPAYPVPGTAWRSGNPKDFAVYGVTGRTVVLGVRRVRVPGGVFHALVVQSILHQKGYRYGSGRRTMWFAPGRGLVKLVFQHSDHSTTRIELLK